MGSVPLVPPWVEELPIDPPPPLDTLPLDGQPAPMTSPLAPSGRFYGARVNLGGFAASGGGRQMRRALGYYVRDGYGGGREMTRRMGGTARTAARLGAALQSGTAVDLTAARNAALAGGKNAEVVLDAIVEAVRPIDGTQDAESSRQAVRDALSDVLESYPDADLLDLTDAQREYVVERYVALDVLNRFRLDVGRSVQARAPDLTTAMRRFAEIREFIAETVAASFRRVRDDQAQPTGATLADITTRALAQTFAVFEEYL